MISYCIILAQTVPTPAPAPDIWREIWRDFGWPGIIILILWRYLPRVIEAHIEFTQTASKHIIQNAESQKKTAEALEVLSGGMEKKLHPIGDPMYREHIFSTVGTNKAIRHVAKTIAHLAESMGPQVLAKIQPHIDAVEDILGKAINTKS